MNAHKNIFRVALVAFLVSASDSFRAQDQHLIDSLKKSLQKVGNDTSRCNILDQLIEASPDPQWQNYNDELKTFAEKKLLEKPAQPFSATYKKYLGKTYFNEGLSNHLRGKIDEALACYSISIKLDEEIGYKAGVAAGQNNIGNVYSNMGQFAKALGYYTIALKLRKECGDQAGVSSTFSNIGYIYEKQGQIKKALDYYNRSLKIAESIGQKSVIAAGHCNIGVVHHGQGQIKEALDSYMKALKIQEEIGDEQAAAATIANIGSIHQYLGNVDEALAYYNKAAGIQEKIGDKHGIANTVSSMGVLLAGFGRKKEALENYERSLKIREEINDLEGIASTLNNIGMIYSKDKQSDKAWDYFERGLKIQKQIDEKHGMTISMINLGFISYWRGQKDVALSYGLQAFSLAKEIGNVEATRNSANLLTEVFEAQGKKLKALEMMRIFVKMRDSINNKETRKAALKKQIQYEYEKKAMQDNIAHARDKAFKNAELARRKAEIEKRESQQYAVFGGLGLVIVFGGFLFNRFRVAQKQKLVIEVQTKEVEQQKKLAEAKQQEVLDSIRYARRIQMAMIPNENTFGKLIRISRKNS